MAFKGLTNIRFFDFHHLMSHKGKGYSISGFLTMQYVDILAFDQVDESPSINPSGKKVDIIAEK